MKHSILFLLLVTLSCNTKEPAIASPDAVKTKDTVQPHKTGSTIRKPETYANQRFRNVTVESVDQATFRVKGEAQIFEANFGWVVEDGHNEVAKGNEMTGAGAPEWGAFDFTLHATKKRENTTLTLILFEVSAKDGSRQHELPISLTQQP